MYAVKGHHLRPLFCFSNLTDVSLAPPVGFDLDDVTVSDMARAWPHIQWLILGAGSYAHVASRVTLQGLYAFAQHCPELHFLQISLDASAVPLMELCGKTRVSQGRLTTLRVPCSTIVAPISVVAFLSSIFPKLSHISTERDLTDNQDEGEPDATAIMYHQYWKFVELMLPVLETVREEERYWAQNSGL
ncbi:hypothetical protein B0H10DRAFT_1786661 [Mycena sp. CBHHK59/15]|nr:hypothetical protein B0H10DRAFT_1786661 [Mycena sp. CBHHK59/15]